MKFIHDINKRRYKCTEAVEPRQVEEGVQSFYKEMKRYNLALTSSLKSFITASGSEALTTALPDTIILAPACTERLLLIKIGVLHNWEGCGGGRKGTIYKA